MKIEDEVITQARAWFSLLTSEGYAFQQSCDDENLWVTDRCVSYGADRCVARYGTAP